MLGIIEKINRLKSAKKGADTWILELPTELCSKEGFAEGTMISLTVKNGGIQTAIIQPSAEIDDFINRVIEDEKEFFEEMKRIGD